MQLTWDITIGQVIASGFTLLGFICTALTFVYAIRQAVAVQGAEFTSFTTLIHAELKASATLIGERLNTLGGRMINVEGDLKEVGKCMTLLAEQGARLVAMDNRLNAADSRFDRIQRDQEDWRGWVRKRIDELEQNKENIR